MNLLQQLVNMVHGSQGHQQAPIVDHYPMSSALSHAQPIAPVAPKVPIAPAGGQVSPQSQAQYQQMLAQYQQMQAPQPQGFSLQSVANMMPQQSQLQGRDNPGLIPLQGSRGLGTNPQMQAYNNPQQRNYSPQNPYQMY